MKSDKSRETFGPTKHFSSVRLQQGRVLTDADWNEQSDIIEHRDETTSLDVIGQSGAPVGASGFMIGNGGFVNGIADLTISAGRMYVDGILCEQEDPALRYSAQPDPVYDTNLDTPPTIPTGLVLAYLDVWERHIGVVEDPLIREIALGGPDTATRAKTVWQVKTVAVDTQTGATPASTLAGLQLPADQQGMLAARAEPTDAATDPCIIPQAAGFRSLENQLYRVEVHTPGTLDDATDGTNGSFPAPGGPAPTFKWSRDNGSVVAAWIDDPQPLPNTLKVQLLTNDPTRGFSTGNWVELSDDSRDLSGFGGIFAQLTKVEGDVLTYDPGSIMEFVGLPAVPPISRPSDNLHPKVRRWDMPVGSGGPQPIIRQPSTDPVNEPGGMWIDLEAGVQVQFQAGTYRTGDYWMIPARTANNGIEWPPTSTTDSSPAKLPPVGIQHHFACLATFNLSSGEFQGGFADCRKVFSPLTDLNPATAVDQPQPDEFRYYLVDGSGAIGSDANGKVGISSISAPQAYTDAVPFATLSAAMKFFPRDGNGSVAVIMLSPLIGDSVRYDNLVLQGVHGYKKILVRCSAFVGAGDALKIDPLDDLDWVVLGGRQLGGAFALNPRVTSSALGNVINVSPGTPIGVETDSLIGERLRFLPGSSTDLASMVLGNQNAGGVETLSIGDTFGDTIPGGTDQFVLDAPAATISFVEISIVGGERIDLERPGVSIPTPNLSLAGLQVSSLMLTGSVSAEVAFCAIETVRLTQFGTVKITPDYTDELAVQRSVGVGVNVNSILAVEDGDQIQIRNSVGSSTSVGDVDDVEIGGGFFAQVARIGDCSRFSIGAPLQVLGESPRLIRLGSNLTAGAALMIADSDGAVQGTSFDIQNIHLQSGAPFDFDSNDGVDLAAIQFSGTGQSLRIRDVDLTVATTQGPIAASGVLLDATNAVSSIFDYEQRTGMTVSGLIALPGRCVFRPIELAYTDVRDPANNHFLSPSVSSADVAGGAITLASGQGRSFIERGISVQGFTKNPPGIERFRVVQFVGDGTSRVQLAHIDINNPDRATQIATSIGASIAGVSQRQILNVEDSKAFGSVVASGYTLISLEGGSNLSSLPAPLYCSQIWGFATTTPPTESDLAVVQIGVLVRIVASNGLGGNTAGDPLIGLARLQINPNGVPGSPAGE
jgi:hypothetical protein